MCYKLKEEEILLICGPFVSRIKYNEIKKISKISHFKEWGFGVGMPGYYFGYSFSRKSPTIVYATTLADVIVIETDKKMYVISPEDEDVFIKFLNEKVSLTDSKSK